MTFVSGSAIIVNMKQLTQILLVIAIVGGSFLTPLSASIEPIFTEAQTGEVHYEYQIVIEKNLAQAQKNDTQGKLKVTCGLWIDVGCKIGNFLLWYFELIWYKTTQILAFLAGFLVDVLLYHSISSATYRTGVIEAGWEILRNFINIVFIFSLMAIAFKMVLGNNDSGTKKSLMKTLLVALVINFSLFMCYAIIDASNIMANIFYNRIQTEGTVTTGAGNGAEFLQNFFENQNIKSPSAAIVNNFNPQRIVTKINTELNFFQAWIMIFAAGGINILMIMLFTSIMLLFLGRTIGLMIVTILAPIAFATLTVPISGVDSLSWVGFKPWLKQLVSLSFMAPVYLFFLYLIVVFAGSDALFNSIAVANNGTVSGSNILNVILGVLIPFALIAMLLYAAKKVTTNMAGEVGGMLASVITKAAKGAASVAAVGTGVGLAAVAAGGGAIVGGALRAGAVGGRANTTGRWLQTRKFDVSQIPGFGQTLGKTGVGRAVGRGLNTSYADADVAVRTGANAVRSRYNDMRTVRTPESVKKWQKTVQESRDGLTARRIENFQRKELKDAKIDSANKDRRIITGIDPKTGAKIYGKELQGKGYEEALEIKQAQLAKRSSTKAKKDKDRIRKDQQEVQLQIDAKQDEVKKLNKESTPDKAKIRKARKKIEELKKRKLDVEKTGLEGEIRQIEKLIEKQKSSTRATLLKKDGSDGGRTTTQDSAFTVGETNRKKRTQKQAARIGSGQIKTTPKIGGDPDNA